MDSPDKADDSKTGFRKPTNDNANRKYRRRSSISLSPPPGSPKQRSYRSQNSPREDSSRINDDDDGHIRQKDNRECDRSSGRNAKSGDSYRYDRGSFRDSRSYKRHDDEDRDHSKLPEKTTSDSHSRDSRYRISGSMKKEDEYKRSRDGDKYAHKRYINDADSHKIKHAERRSSSFLMEKDMRTRKDDFYENRGSRTAWGDSRTGRSSYDDAKASRSDLTKDSGCGSNETDPVDYQRLTREENRSVDYRETNITRDRDSRGSRRDSKDEFGYSSRRPPSPSKKLKLTNSNKREPSQRTTVPNNVNDVDNINLDAAKVAALRAAELVNNNLVGVGVAGALSTDQKKKLLWGNKKKAVEEMQSGHCWDASLFPDREQQEKFNRLMGVKGEVKVEPKAGNPEGKSILDPEKQKELQLDLEKQYTAGLRRRDGRTVGLGL